MENQLAEAATIMVTGMVSVMAFLIMTIGAMSVLRRIAYTPESESHITNTKTTIPKQHVAAISAAIQHYRRSKHSTGE